MALINCPECGKEISDKAKNCIHCGYPLASVDAKSVAGTTKNDESPNKTALRTLSPKVHCKRIQPKTKS